MDRQRSPRGAARTDDDEVILVDRDDVAIGAAPKGDVHRTGALHRAVSVFVFDDARRLLLQRRARGKYHSPLLWSNTACGHPRPGESTADAASRRLGDEMGVECALTEVSVFTYRAELGTAIEHEVDHLFVGYHGAAPVPDPGEVEAWSWVDANAALQDCERNPARYTAWFAGALRHVLSALAGTGHDATGSARTHTGAAETATDRSR